MSEMKSLYLSKEQFYKECHIAKRTALWLIQSGLVPAIDTGRRTCRYLIARGDVETYLLERELHPAEYHYIKSAAEAPRTVCPAPRGKGGQASLERLWANELDLLTLEKVTSLLGYPSRRIMAWTRTKELKSLTVAHKLRFPKKYLIEFVLSPTMGVISPKSTEHLELLRRIDHVGE